MSKTERDISVDKKNQQETGKKAMAPIIFNTLGLEPTSAEFVISKKDLADEILKVAKGILLDASSAEITFFAGEGKSYDAYLWLKSDSADLCDKSLMTMSDSAIKVNTVRYSDELRRFMDVYAKNQIENGRDIGPRLHAAKATREYKGIQIDLLKFFVKHMDIFGQEYSKLYGGSPLRTNIVLSAITDRKENLTGFSIVKKYPTKSDKKYLAPMHTKKL